MAPPGYGAPGMPSGHGPPVPGSGAGTPYSSTYGYQQYQQPPASQSYQRSQHHQYGDPSAAQQPPAPHMGHQQPYSYGPPQPYSHLPPPSQQPSSQQHPSQLQNLPQHHPPGPPVSHQPAPLVTHTLRGDDGTLESATSSHRDSVFQQPLVSISRIDEATGRKYHLDVAQQPQRARMCGFGDKDRRPITPPPCVRLVITDIKTGKEIDCNDIDHAMFVLNVDLWDAKGENEVNLVRSSQGTPSISSTTPYSYSTLNSGDTTPVSSYTPQMLPSNQPMGYPQDYGQFQPGYSQVSPTYSSNGGYGAPYFQPPPGYRPDHGMASQAMAPYGRNGSVGAFPDPSQSRVSVFGSPPTGMYSRNLIGSLAASAFRLSDTEDKIGIWFVLQDLSVRTEGSFRLRFSFVNVGAPSGAPRDENASKVNTGRAPILASAFSSAFTVYSAKKFPGVCESTPLSKTFATQGIKIPIRKDANVKGEGGEDDDY